ncbi:hypothetical protein L218DRAFT_1045066 [Marasmius fiardii PR-910]|nr:hypothetical protein L218DRAFT_1045066 [Marasmius fiardii PR-910]
MASPLSYSPSFTSDYSILAASSNLDRDRRIALTQEYPKEVWYFLASFIGFISLCRIFSWACKNVVRSGGPTQLKEGNGLSLKSVIRWRRLPWAVMSLYRIFAFRLVFTVGGYSLNMAEVALTCSYIVVLFTWTFVNTTTVAGKKLDVMYWSNRSGTLVASQLPLITALGTKNSAISLVTGISFEKLNYLHRMTARVVFVLLCLHCGSRLQLGIGHFMEETFMHMGLMAGFAFLLVCIITMRPIRRKAYELSFYSHVILVLIFLVGAYLHTREFNFDTYVWPSFVIWGVDRFIRAVRLLVFNFGWGRRAEMLDASAELISSKLVRLTLKRPPHFRWSPGHTAFLVFPDVSTLPFETHPFTIASYDSGLDNREFMGSSSTAESVGDSRITAKESEVTTSPAAFWKELVFLVNVNEGLTKRLAQRVSKTSTIRVYVDGPYGSSPNVASYDTSVLIAGGSGVSFTLPLFLDTIEQVRKGKSHCQRLTFLWCIRNSDDLQWISEALYKAVLLAPQSLEIAVDVFITRPELSLLSSSWDGTATLDGSSDASLSKKDLSQTPANSTSSLLTLGCVRIFNGRPDLPAYLKEQAELTRDGHMAVSVCGSQSIANAVRQGLSFPVSGPLEILRGGASVTLHVETFGYA